MRCRSVCLLLVAMLATQHTDFESFANALGALPNQPPVPMACEPSPSPIDVDTNAIVQKVVDVLLKHYKHYKHYSSTALRPRCTSRCSAADGSRSLAMNPCPSSRAPSCQPRSLP